MSKLKIMVAGSANPHVPGYLVAPASNSLVDLVAVMILMLLALTATATCWPRSRTLRSILITRRCLRLIRG